MLSVNSIPIFAEFLRTFSHTCAAVNMQCDLPVNTSVPEPANSSRAPPFPGNSANNATVELHRLRTMLCRSSEVRSIATISLLLLMTLFRKEEKPPIPGGFRLCPGSQVLRFRPFSTRSGNKKEAGEHRSSCCCHENKRVADARILTATFGLDRFPANGC